MTTAAPPRRARCGRRSARRLAASSATPRKTHQNAIVAGSVDPKGSGARATAANNIHDDTRFEIGEADRSAVSVPIFAGYLTGAGPSRPRKRAVQRAVPPTMGTVVVVVTTGVAAAPDPALIVFFNT